MLASVIGNDKSAYRKFSSSLVSSPERHLMAPGLGAACSKLIEGMLELDKVKDIQELRPLLQRGWTVPLGTVNPEQSNDPFVRAGSEAQRGASALSFSTSDWPAILDSPDPWTEGGLSLPIPLNFLMP